MNQLNNPFILIQTALAELVLRAVAASYNKEVELPTTSFSLPPNRELGDLAFACFTLAKDLGSTPNEIADKLSSKINELIKVDDTATIVLTTNSAGPYINFVLRAETVASLVLTSAGKLKKNFGQTKVSKQSKVMIEFSQANTHKAFHVGHILGTSLGESLARLNEFAGQKVLRANYQGDTGSHVAKWLWNYHKNHSKEKIQASEHWIASLYVEAITKLAEDKAGEEEVKKINLALEAGSDKKLNALWQKSRSQSLAAFEKIYKDLDTHFNNYFFESKVEARAKEIALQLVKKRIAKASQGAIIIDFADHNLPALGVWVLLRQDGTVLYSAKDLALAELKFNKYKVDEAIYVVGNAQSLHIQQLFATLKLMKFKQASACKYIPVHEVRLPWGKMSSRTGDNVLYDDFKNDLVKKVSVEIKKREPKISAKELDKRALTIAISAVKYSFLRHDTSKNIIFDPNTSLKFEGDTGPYLLYCYARLKSIIRQAKVSKTKKSSSYDWQNEKFLLLELAQFPSIVDRATRENEPSLLASYLYQLAKTTTEYYHQVHILTSSKEVLPLRLNTIKLVSETLSRGLNLLGIITLDVM